MSEKIKYVASDGLPTYYVNNIQIQVSNLDMRLTLGEIQSKTADGLEIKPLAKVFMSLEHCKALHALLGRMLDKSNELTSQAEAETKAH